MKTSRKEGGPKKLAIRTERLKAIGDLAGGVAHNFNNLLQMVMGGIDLALVDLEMGNLSELKKTLETTPSEFRSRAPKLLGDSRAFAQVSGKIQPAEGEVFDLSETVKQTAEMTKPLWKTGPYREGIKSSPESGTHGTMFCERKRKRDHGGAG